MLTNHQLLIDKNCPMCRVYGTAFEKMKLIDAKTVAFYQEISTITRDKINAVRARSEIALVNQTNDEVTYGAKAFLKILFHRLPFLYQLFTFPPIYWLVNKCYRFVSFNRKVIAPPVQGVSCTCTPPFHLGYRLAYLLFTALLTGYILNQFSALLLSQNNVTAPVWQEYAICFGQLLWQGALVFFIAKDKLMDYLGNMSTVSLIGGIGVSVILMFNAWLPIHFFGLVTLFGAVVTFMFFLHIKRTQNLGLPLGVSLSWVLYRVVVLGIILITIL